MGRYSLAFIVLSFLVFCSDAEDIEWRLACLGYDISDVVACKKDHVIEVIKAEFGRSMLRTCEINGKEKKTCGMKNVLDKMLPLCEGKQRCDKMIVNATEFGDPGKCRGIRTYLVMDIRCVLKIKTTDDHEEQGPIAEESSKKKAVTIVVDKKTMTNDVNFQVRHNGSTSATRPLQLLTTILAIVGTLLGLHC